MKSRTVSIENVRFQDLSLDLMLSNNQRLLIFMGRLQTRTYGLPSHDFGFFVIHFTLLTNCQPPYAI